MTYCTRSDIEDLYGERTVAAWAAVDGDEDAAGVTARIERAIEFAEAYVKGRMREGHYSLDEPVDPVIQDATAKVAGHWLYSRRGMIDDEGGEGAGRKLDRDRKDADRTLDMVEAGILRLDQSRGHDGPTVPEVGR